MDGNRIDYRLGCRMPIEQWLWLNRTGIFERPELREYACVFPPVDLMHNVSGLQDVRDFAKHGTDLFAAVSEASPRPLTEYGHILDFGCGSGRLARLFKGHPGKLSGCDIDRRHVAFVNEHLGFMEAKVSGVHPPLPFAENEFDGVIAISVFTHLDESSQDEFLADLWRVSGPGAYLFLTVHGARALARAEQEQRVWALLGIEHPQFAAAKKKFTAEEHAFILQHGHLTVERPARWWLPWLRSVPNAAGSALLNEPYRYGITFVPESYVREHWSRWFIVTSYRHAAIHDFQDMVVLQPRK
jgi:SAM-dependent methyltransferase